MKLLLVFYFLTSSVIYASNPGYSKISSLDFESPSSELAPFYLKTQDAQMIGIGESAHGSKTISQARGRLVKYFVKNHQYRMVLLEDGFLATEKVNTYLESCLAEPESPKLLDQALKALNLYYRTQETVGLLKWLCQFSKREQEQIYFHGIDQWEDPWNQREAIAKGLELIDSDFYKTNYQQALENCYAWSVSSWDEAEKKGLWDYLLQTWRLDAEENRQCLGALINLERVMNRESKSDYEMFMLNLAIKVAYVYQQYRDLFYTDISRALNLRDDIQAFLSIAWYERHNVKTLLLEHNIHISKRQSVVTPPDAGSKFKWQNVSSTGENLIGYFGADYKSIGVTAHEVESARDGKYPISTKKDSLDYQLSLLGDLYFVDPNGALASQNQYWWMHTESLGMYLNPSEQYDAILFIKKSPASKILEL